MNDYELDEMGYYEDEDAPSWTELMQDYYPTTEDGKVFDTESGF